MAGKSSKSEAELAETVAAAQQGNGPLTGGEAVGVDKIRDLLFGNQMQDYDRRFSKLEERFLQRFKDIESETARNLSAFESNAKKQVESLVGQLREEKDVRADADKELRCPHSTPSRPPRRDGSPRPRAQAPPAGCTSTNIPR